jgi:repressor LexA
MVDTVQKIKDLMGLRKINAGTLAAKSGLSRDTIYKILRHERVARTETLRKIAGGLGVNLVALTGGEGLPAEEKLRRAGEQVFPATEGSRIQLPVVGVIKAGAPVLATENIEGFEPIDEESYRRWGPDLFFLRVRGDSMEPDHIPEGSKVLIRKQTAAEPHEIAVVIVNGDEATLKRVRYLDDQAFLYASNPKYLPQIYPASDVEIIGVRLRTIID